MRIEDFKDRELAAWVERYVEQQAEEIRERKGKVSALYEAIEGRSEEAWHWRRRVIELSRLWFQDRHFDVNWFPSCREFPKEAAEAKRDGLVRRKLKQELLERWEDKQTGASFYERQAKALEALLDETEHVDWGPRTAVPIQSEEIY